MENNDVSRGIIIRDLKSEFRNLNVTDHVIRGSELQCNQNYESQIKKCVQIGIFCHVSVRIDASQTLIIALHTKEHDLPKQMFNLYNEDIN